MASSSSNPSILLFAATRPVYKDELFLQFKSHMIDALGKDITLIQFDELKGLIDVDIVVYTQLVYKDKKRKICTCGLLSHLGLSSI